MIQSIIAYFTKPRRWRPLPEILGTVEVLTFELSEFISDISDEIEETRDEIRLLETVEEELSEESARAVRVRDRLENFFE